MHRTRTLTGLVVVFCFFVSLPAAQGAVVGTGDLSPADLAFWQVGCYGYVGQSSTGTLTVGGGSILSTYAGYLGYYPGATGTVTVTGNSSEWTTSLLYVGYSGNGTMIVEAGGKTSPGICYLGYNTGSTGMATLQGTGSVWSSDSIYVGTLGSGILKVNNGGVVYVKTLYAATGDLLGNGTITAQGAVMDAGFVFDKTHGRQQSLAFGAGGSLNLNVDGSGNLGAGYKGAGTLRIAEGVSLTSYHGYLGYQTGSTGTATVTGTGSLWTNKLYLYVGNSGSGTLNVEAGGQVSDTLGYLGYNAGSTGTATVTGAGSKWTNSMSLNVGYSGSGTLKIEAGAQVTSGGVYVGYDAGSIGAITVTGPGSTLTGGRLTVGNNGSGSLTVANGGLVTASVLFASPNDLYGDGTITTTGIVSDIDLTFDSTHGLTQTFAFGTGGTLNLNALGGLGAGYRGAATLRIAEGVSVASSFGYLGYWSGSTGAATVIGAGSKWTHGSGLIVGNYGNGTLNVEAGAQVSNGAGSLGEMSGSTGAATVTGAGSTWTNNDLFVGKVGSGMLTVADGGVVTARTLYASLSSLAGNGTITTQGAVLDADLVFDVVHGTQQAIDFGRGGKLNLNLSSNFVFGVGYKDIGTLRISEAARITTDNGYLGYYAGSNGTATVAGTGSMWWTASRHLFIGNYGNGTLNIEAGGYVLNENGFMAYMPGSTGTARIAGAKATWKNNLSLLVGYYGSGVLNVEASGSVENSDSYLGYYAGSAGTATVAGAGSKWTNHAIYVGYLGQGALNIAEGGEVTSWDSYLGNKSGAVGTATVTGTGSKWTSNGAVYVGYDGSGTLTVADGGLVTVGTLFASLSNLSGNGTIATRGAVLDGDIVIDLARGPQPRISFGTGGAIDITLNGTSTLGAGYKGAGTLRIADGMTATSFGGLLGFSPGSSGTATVTGLGSTWTNKNTLTVGDEGSGVLNIEAGGQVNSSYGYIGSHAGSTGKVTVTGAGSTWANSSDLNIQGVGTLIIEAGGQVSNAEGHCTGTVTVRGTGSKWISRNSILIGDGGGGILNIEAGGEVISNGGSLANTSSPAFSTTVNVADATWTSAGGLRIGFTGTGTLNIKAGGHVTNTDCYIGYNAGSNGTATVSGAGSQWISSSDFYVGNYGKGSLNVEAGGQVNNTRGYLGFNSKSTGTVTVNGAGSKWINSSSLYVGYSGSGTLNIASGGAVTAGSVSINSTSLLAIDVGYGSLLTVGNGTGTITNYGKVRIVAGIGPKAGDIYTPIVAGTLSGTGAYQVLGGVWNSTTRKFTVSETLSGSSGTAIAVDLAKRQRVLINDGSHGWSVGASLLAKTGTTAVMNFTATALDANTLASLSNKLNAGQMVVGGWNFSATGKGYTAGDPMYLSFDVGNGFPRSELNLWRCTAGTWASYSPSDLTYNGQYASFTTTDLGTFAMTAPVPEPSTFALLGMGAIGLLGWAWRRRK